jgi:hypothetical protein
MQVEGKITLLRKMPCSAKSDVRVLLNMVDQQKRYAHQEQQQQDEPDLAGRGWLATYDEITGWRSFADYGLRYALLLFH